LESKNIFIKNNVIIIKVLIGYDISYLIMTATCFKMNKLPTMHLLSGALW
jgi:hypothetical protein